MGRQDGKEVAVRSGVKTDVGIALVLGLLGAALGQRFVGLSLPFPPPYWQAVSPLLLAPALEELVFRVGLQGGLQAAFQSVFQSAFQSALPASGQTRLRDETENSKIVKGISPSRQYLYTELAANTVASMCFAACHAPAHGWVALWWLLPSLVLGELWRRHRSWAVCAGVHAGFNGCLAAVTLAQ
jgi:membrane protease YdiL (CAAX protease family)